MEIHIHSAAKGLSFTLRDMPVENLDGPQELSSVHPVDRIIIRESEIEFVSGKDSTILDLPDGWPQAPSAH